MWRKIPYKISGRGVIILRYIFAFPVGVCPSCCIIAPPTLIPKTVLPANHKKVMLPPSVLPWNWFPLCTPFCACLPVLPEGARGLLEGFVHLSSTFSSFRHQRTYLFHWALRRHHAQKTVCILYYVFSSFWREIHMIIKECGEYWRIWGSWVSFACLEFRFQIIF